MNNLRATWALYLCAFSPAISFAQIVNPGFEQTNAWVLTSSGPPTVSYSTDWANEGVRSMKFYRPAGILHLNGSYAKAEQTIASTFDSLVFDSLQVGRNWAGETVQILVDGNVVATDLNGSGTNRVVSVGQVFTGTHSVAIRILVTGGNYNYSETRIYYVDNIRPTSVGDADGDGLPGTVEDPNQNGVVDVFETSPIDPAHLAYPIRARVTGVGNPVFLLDPFRIFNQAQLEFNWQWFLTNNPTYLGVRWKFDQTPLSPVTDSDAFIYKTTSTLQRTCTNAGAWYFHVAPVTSGGLVDTNWLTHMRVKYNPAASQVASITHPNTNLWYPNPLVSLTWSPGHGDTNSVVRSYYVWDSNANTVPTTNDTSTTDYVVGLFEPINGTHYFHVLLQDPAGFLSDTAHFRVNVGEGSGIPPVAEFSADTTDGVAPLTVYFTDLSTGDITSWAWDFDGNGSIDDTSPNPLPVVYSIQGSYTVRLTVSGSGGSDTETKTNYIVVTPPAPVADFSASPTNGYPPLEVTFTDQSSGSITNRLWDFNGDGVNEATNPVAPIRYIYSQAGSYSVSMTVLGAGGSSTKTRTNYVTVNVIPPPMVNFSGGPVSGYAPLQVSFTNLSSGNITNVMWDFNGDGVNEATNPAAPVSWTYSQAGTYSPALTAVGPGGSTTLVRTNYIVAIALPPAPVAEFVGTPLSGAAPLQVTFTDQSSGTISNRQWDFDNDGVMDATNPAAPIRFTYAKGGTYTVKLVVSGPGGTGTRVRTGYVQVLNGRPVAVVATNQIYLQSLGDHADVDASRSYDPDGDVLFYSWREDPRNPVLGLIPLVSQGLSRVRLYFPKPGIYVFEVAVSDGQAVSDTNPDATGAQGQYVTVYVPGINATTYAFPSDDVVRLADTQVGVFPTQADADNWRNFLDLAVSDSEGRVRLESLNLGGGGYLDTIVKRRNQPAYLDAQDSRTIGVAGLVESYGMKRGILSQFAGTVYRADMTPASGVQVAVISGFNLNGNPTTTAANGGFTCADVWKGSWLLQLMHANGADVRDIQVREGVSPKIILNDSGGLGTLRGRVYLLGTDKAVSGATVELGFGGTYSDVSDVNGYVIPNVPVGTYVCWVRKSGYETYRQTRVRIASGNNDLDFGLVFAGSGPVLLGQLVDATDQRPVVGASAGIVGTSGLLVRSAVSDKSGYFMIRDVPQGTQHVAVAAAMYERKEFDLNITGQYDYRLISMNRGARWQPAQPLSSPAPFATLSASKTELAYVGDSARLTGGATNYAAGELLFIWREGAENPNLGANIPAGAQAISAWDFRPVKPGLYVFELQVKRNGIISPNTATVQISVPGFNGYACLSPSAGVYPSVGVELKIFSSYNDAANWVNPLRVATSVEKGVFSFQNLGRGVYWLAGRDPAGEFQPYGPVKKTVNYASTLNNVEVNMTKARYSVSGIITDQGGQPVEGASVIVAPGMRSESFRTSSFTDGRYYLYEIPRGSHPFMISKAGFEPLAQAQSVVGDTTTMNFVLRAGSGSLAVLRGRVTCQYEGIQVPVPHAQITVGSGLARAFTDQDGNYTIAGLAPGWYTGLVAKDGYRSQLLGAGSPFIQVTAPEKVQDYTLEFNERGPTVRGTVINEVGQRIEGVEIIVLAPRPGPVSKDGGDTPKSNDESNPIPSDEAGVFQLAGVPHGDRQILVRLPDGREVTETVTVEGNTELVCTLAYDTYDLWCSRVFTPDDATNAVVSGPAANPDNDRLPNLFEYVMGYGALTPESEAGSQWVRRSGTNVWLGFRRAVGVSGVTYGVDTCTNLVNPVWTTYALSPAVVGTISNGIEAVEALVPNPGNPPRLFLRLKLTK